ncbi:uncharacterized protein Dana_GF18091 [Drosophila ananassae]|uniref:DUF4485 domain-containing protein n=2 Tax=Drosophila ananassae TaxID=7217 RepID=B3LW56_DROAN|nr:uncharacterized protein Dana_GF18091 [Drosophila ananassae]
MQINSTYLKNPSVMSNSELIEGALDELFVKEVASVVKLVGTLPEKYKIMPTCTLWLNIFQLATHKERFARNYMLVLLHKQLNSRRTLGYPFTDSSCAQKDLCTLQEKMRQLDIRGELTDGDEEVKTFEDKSICFSSGENLEFENRKLMDINVDLANDLQSLKKQYADLEELREENGKAFQIQNEQLKLLEKETRSMKRIFSISAITALKQMCCSHLTTKESFFGTLLKSVCEKESDIAKVNQMESQFRSLLIGHSNYYQKKQQDMLIEKTSDKYDKLRDKVSKRYKKVISMKLDAQEHELTLSAMRYLTILRKLFLSTFPGKATTKKEVSKFLQRSHDELAEML